jgi:hypothetical protein
MMHRKHKTDELKKLPKKRRPKNILVMALRNLVIGDGGISCTKRTYSNIMDRVEDFKRSRKDLRIESRPWGAMVNTRRVA